MKKIAILFLIMVMILIACSNGEPGKTEPNQGVLYPDAELEIMHDNQVVNVITLTEILELEQVEFEATLKSSGNDPVDYTYTGVLLKNIFSYLEIDLNNIAAVIVSAEDGYAVTITIDKIMEEDNVYLAFKKEGEWIENRENNGQGPLHMIISNDSFSQYWCKFVVSINAIK